MHNCHIIVRTSLCNVCIWDLGIWLSSIGSLIDLARFSASPHPWATHSHVRRCTVWSCFNFTHSRSMQSRQILVPVLCASACPVCVSCVSRLPPVSFYRYMFLPPGPLYSYIGAPPAHASWWASPDNVHDGPRSLSASALCVWGLQAACDASFGALDAGRSRAPA